MSAAAPSGTPGAATPVPVGATPIPAVRSDDYPAIKSYFFGKGYRDLWATITEGFRRNTLTAQSSYGQFETEWEGGNLTHQILAALHLAAAASVLVFGTVFIALASIVHALLLGALFAVVYLLFSVVVIGERGYLLLRGFAPVCPGPHERIALPVYFCDNPRCRRKHERLIPSSYGILHHTCRCGQELPATFFLNRGRLQSCCGLCGTLLSRSHHETRKAFIAVVGGPSVGKSAFLFSAVRELIEAALPARGLSHRFVDAAEAIGFQHVVGGLRQGRPPDKTIDKLPRALTVEVGGGAGPPLVLYLYDPAGEAYWNASALGAHKYQGFLSGVIFLIDPFSFPEVQREYEGKFTQGGTASTLRVSETPAGETLARLMISLDRHVGATKRQRLEIPCAVVVNKVDAFDLERRILTAPAPDQSRLPEADAQWSTSERAIRESLRSWGQTDILHQVEGRFRAVRYFTCSALGRSPDGSGRGLRSRGVLEPMLWLLGRVDRRFQLGDADGGRGRTATGAWWAPRRARAEGSATRS